MSLKRNAKSNATAVMLLATLLFAASYAIAQDNSHSNGSQRFVEEYPHVTLTTSMGNILVELDPARAPQTVENFLTYVDDGYYNGTIFHRVIDGFMIQGGGFTADFKRKTTRAPVSNEAYNGLRNSRYTIAMARTNAPHSATSQFFINSANNNNLDHTDTSSRGWGYTVFGRVVEGFEVVDAISATRTSSGGPFSRDVPTTSIVINGVERAAALQNEAAEGSTGNNGAGNNNQASDTAKSADSTDEPNAAAANPDSDAMQSIEPSATKTSLEANVNVERGPLFTFIELFRQN